MALPNDHSGRIADRQTSTLLLAAGTAASALLLQNTSNSPLWVNWGAPASQGPGSFLLAPGQSIDSSVVPVGAALYGWAPGQGLGYTLKTD